LLLTLSSCSWQWVAARHLDHGHTQGDDNHLIGDYRSEARLYTRYWKNVDNIPHESNWNRVANCESGGDWNIDTGNGYYGGLQFSLETWRAYGGSGYPNQNSKRNQIIVAERVRTQSGLGQWPNCGGLWHG
jgi:hypothetical protein